MTLEHNFPMALDEADHRLFVTTHQPARLSVFDSNTGKAIAILRCVQDADDTYYHAGRKRIYVPGGEGSSACSNKLMRIITDFSPHVTTCAKVPSTLGARTAGYFGKGRKGFDRFFLAGTGGPRRGNLDLHGTGLVSTAEPRVPGGSSELLRVAEFGTQGHDRASRNDLSVRAAAKESVVIPIDQCHRI